jgi:3-hydroxyisobutyrate dehydrogenase
VRWDLVVSARGADAVAEAEVVITSLPNGHIMKACYADVLPVAREQALFIDASTISVADAREINANAVERGLAQLDAPVSGGVKGATAGTLAFIMGGDDAAVERARPVLEPMAGKVVHCGGAGHRAGRQGLQRNHRNPARIEWSASSPSEVV